MRKNIPDDAHSVRVIAAKAFVDPRSVMRFIRGEQLKPMTRARIELALRDLGIEPAKRRRGAVVTATERAAAAAGR